MELEDIKKALYNYYGIDEENEDEILCGCFINGEWLSIAEVLKAIEEYYKYM